MICRLGKCLLETTVQVYHQQSCVLASKLLGLLRQITDESTVTILCGYQQQVINETTWYPRRHVTRDNGIS